MSSENDSNKKEQKERNPKTISPLPCALGKEWRIYQHSDNDFGEKLLKVRQISQNTFARQKEDTANSIRWKKTNWVKHIKDPGQPQKPPCELWQVTIRQLCDALTKTCPIFRYWSIIFFYQQDQPNPHLGRYLGVFKSELKPEEYISEFCSGSPKNYGYKTSDGDTVCKIRGFSLNYEGSQQLNYQILRQNVLDEVTDPPDTRRITPIVESTKIVRYP